MTDANLVLGRLPIELAGGEITLDVGRAREAIRRQVAEPLGLSVETAALGVLRIVNERMLGALRVVSVQRGVDPRELVLVPFGGAGPVHGVELARLVGIETMLVPPTPGVLSALGFLLADVKNVFSLTRVGLIGALDLAGYNADLAALIEQAAHWLEREGVAADDRRVEIALDLRYRGQAYELPIAMTAPLDAAGLRRAAERFHAEHHRRYGFEQAAGVEVVTLRVTAVGALPKPSLLPRPEEGADASAALIDRNPVWFDDGFVATAVYDRALLRPGNRLAGPAIIAQPDCTTVLHPGDRLRVDGLSNLIVNTSA